MTVQPTRDQLRALADAAMVEPPWEDAGEWQTDGYAEYVVVSCEQDSDGEYDHVAEAANERLGAFIAAADPNTVRDLLDQLDAAEQRIRDLTQEVRDERAACLDQMEQVQIRDARIEAVRVALSNHPRACEKHPDDDVIRCGWKSAVLDVQTALGGER